MKHFYSFVLMCLVAVTLHAEAISESAARAIAGHQLRGDAVVEVSLSSVRKAQAVGATQVATPAYYVFNAEKAGDGFVIVSGDDRVAPIFGYSDNGTFDPNNVPPAMQAMLDAYAEQIAALNDGATAAQNLTGKAAIKPMVTSSWNESAPLNESLPMIGDKYRVTGCVATAMAHLMYYHKWPKNPTESIPAYKFYSSTQKDTIAAAELPSITFDWENMQDVYMVDVTGTVATKTVSDLMRYCGQSVEMVYGTSSSSASTSWVPRSLTDYFGYATSQYVQRICYTQAEWDNLVYDELKAGRPILYRGDKNPGGHAFLGDVYDGNGLFHVNWGWAGKSDGYFVLSVLNPDDQGTGSTAGPYGYIFGQSMIIGVQPGDAVGDGLRMTSPDLKNPGTTSLSRSSKAEDFSLTLTSRFTN